MTAFEIQHHTLCDGWINTETDDAGKPWVYRSRQEAEDALADFLDDCRAAVARGELSPFSPEEYRIAEVNNAFRS